MVRREDVREGSRVVVKATGSGENKPGMVYKCYPTFAVVDYRINNTLRYAESACTLRESYAYGDIERVVHY